MLKGTHSRRRRRLHRRPQARTPTPTKLDEVSYLDVLNRGLRAMDSTAITLCMDNDLPIVVFDLLAQGQRPVHPRGRTRSVRWSDDRRELLDVS